METIAILLILVGVCWKLGVLRAAKDTIESTAEMAVNEIKLQGAEHKSSVVERAAKLKAVDAATVKKAQANIAALKSFDL